MPHGATNAFTRGPLSLAFPPFVSSLELREAQVLLKKANLLSVSAKSVRLCIKPNAAALMRFELKYGDENAFVGFGQCRAVFRKHRYLL
jgi:hypothetical protein